MKTDSKEANFEDGNNVHIHFTDKTHIGITVNIDNFKKWLNAVDNKFFYHLNDNKGNARFSINKNKILFVNYKE